MVYEGGDSDKANYEEEKVQDGAVATLQSLHIQDEPKQISSVAEPKKKFCELLSA